MNTPQTTEQRKPVDILLVEDNPGDVRLVQIGFQRAAIKNTLHIAKDGPTALRRLRCQDEFEDARPIDMVLLDLNLPRMHGLEVLRAIKADPKLKRVPVIILSGSEADEDVSSSYDGYASAYVVKPSTLDTLSEAVEGFWLTLNRYVDLD